MRVLQVQRLGHLFNQGLISGELLRDHTDYVKLVNEKLPGEYKLDDSADLPRDVGGYTVVFDIISQSDEPKLRIPFFARVALKNVCRRLESIGYKNICIAKISVDPGFKLITKLPARKGKSKGIRPK